MRILYCQNFRGQTLVEYSLLLGIVIAILLTLTPMIKRETQSMVKIVADEVGFQNNAEQLDGPGLLSTSVKTTFDRQQRKKESFDGAKHSLNTFYADVSIVESQSQSDLGISE